MAYMITEACISCGSCEPECPNNAISEGEEIFLINPDLCNECVGLFDSSQCAQVCPVEACVPDPNHTETKEQLLEKKKKMHGE